MGIEYTKRRIVTAEDYIRLREQYLIEEALPMRTDEEWDAADKHMDVFVDDYFLSWKQYRGGMSISKIGKMPSFILAYIASRVILTNLAEQQVNFENMISLYTELKELQPEKADYWQEKTNFAEKLRVMSLVE